MAKHSNPYQEEFGMKGLTEKQKDILDFIEEFVEKEGMAPTVYEIAERFGIKTSTVFAHLRALQRKKQLSRSSKARSISLTARLRGRKPIPGGAIMVPLLGRINAGLPLDSQEDKEGDISVPTTFLDNCSADQLYALRVQGESMRDLGIYEDDIVVVCRSEAAPRAGDIVVALVRGSETTVKSYFSRPGGKVELRAANPNFTTQVYAADEVTLQGKVVGLLRKY